jgi:hypothetical protein
MGAHPDAQQQWPHCGRARLVRNHSIRIAGGEGKQILREPRKNLAEYRQHQRKQESMGEIVHPDFRLPRPSADGSRAKMSGSMKIVVAEFVNQARNKSAASADSEDQITEDYVLLTLGDWGSACCLMDPTGEPVWVPTMDGIEQFNELSTGEATGIRNGRHTYPSCRILQGTRPDAVWVRPRYAHYQTGDAAHRRNRR